MTQEEGPLERFDGTVSRRKTDPRPTTVPSSTTPMFKIHIYNGWGIRSRHRRHGPMDLAKMLVAIGAALGHPDLHHIYVSRVKK